MTNLANWQDDIEALGADFDGSLSGLCIMSLSFDFTPSGLGAAGGALASGQNASAAATNSSGSHFASAQSKTTSANVEASLASGARASLAHHSHSSSRLSSTTTLGLHHHHLHQELFNENSMNAFKRFKCSLKGANQQGGDQGRANDEEDASPAEDRGDEQRLSRAANLSGNEQIVRQIQNQLKNCLTSAASLSTNSTLTTHHSSISLASHQAGVRAIEAAKTHCEQNERDERASDTSTPPANSSHSTGSSASELEDDDEEQDGEEAEEEDEEEEEEEEQEEEDDEHDDNMKSSPSSISSSISAYEEDEHEEVGEEEAETGDSRSPSPRAHNSNNNNNNISQQDSQDLRMNTNNAHKVDESRRSRRSGARTRAEKQRSRRRASKGSLNGRTRDTAKADMPLQLASFSIKDNLLNGGSLKESSYTTSVITTTAPMHFKGLHHHHHHHPHPFSMKHTFPPSPYHQFSNSSFNHDLYDRYVSHDGHQPLQTPLIGIERTQDLLSLKLPPHGLDTADTDSQRCTKDWLFGASATVSAVETNNNNNNNSNNNQQQHKSNPATLQAAAAHENNERPASQSTAIANDLSLTNNQQDADTKRRRLFEADQRQEGARRQQRDLGQAEGGEERRKCFQFSYKSGSNSGSTIRANNSLLNHLDELQTGGGQREPIDLNVNFGSKVGQDPEEQKSNMFDESMKHFNPNRMLTACYDGAKQSEQDAEQQDHKHQQSHQQQHDQLSGQHQGAGENNGAPGAGGSGNSLSLGHQYHGQESMFALEQTSKQKFQYVLAAPISVATKVTEDTMTYLNQGQAYEIKLENITDVSEVKKGFMCSIINIGFHERHMQQMENALWQQWSQQHPGERIFSVDMKLSYNVFGVESDGLNKYEFLWDSSKAAGVFIRINSISTEFTPRKHGGEKGIPFKLSIETFSYNSKTHDSYFISAACCQIKVFKPKGAERKIRSDRDKIFKRPASELDKYHQSCDHTIFKECSLSSLHPLVADDSIGYYRHSHGHFASKQNNGPSARCMTAASTTPSSSSNRLTEGQSESNQQQQQQHRSQNLTQHDNEDSPASSHRKSQHHASDSDNSRSAEYLNHSRGANDNGNASITNRPLSDYSTNRLLQSSHPLDNYRPAAPDENSENQSNNYGSSYAAHTGLSHELAATNHFATQQAEMNGLNHHYHKSNSGIQRSLSSLTGANPSAQPFGMSYYGQHHASAHGSGSSAHIPQAPAQPPGPLFNQHSHYGGLSLASGNVSTSALGPAYQAAAAAAAAAAVTTRAMPANINRQLSLGEKANNNHNHSVTSFRASHLALASNHHDNSASNQCGDNSQQSVNKEHPQSVASLHAYQQQNSDQNLQHSFESAHHPDARSHINTDHNHHHPPQSSTALPQLYRNRSASTSFTKNIAHHSSYLSGGSLVHHHQHAAINGNAQQANHQRTTIADCYNSLNDSAINSGWQSPFQHSNPSCLSRGCSSNSHHCYNAANLHHAGLGYQPTGSSAYLHQHVQEHHHYEQHSEQNSPQKSHNSNDSPLSCYSRYRDNLVNTNDNNNTMSSYASQQQHSHYGHDQHSSEQQHLEQQHERDDHKQQHQDHSLDNISRSSSSVLGTLTHRIASSSTCTEVLAWLVSNRFGHLTKTFSNFSGADLLRLSKSELVEICGLPDGIRLFNSLHEQPIRTKRKTFRTLRIAQMKRDIKLKRRLK